MPGDGSSVRIPTGKTVVLDVSTARLAGLTVEGTLKFADERDLELTSGWVMVMGQAAKLDIGTQTAPFTHKAVLTLTGAVSSADMMGCGMKFVCAMNGGALEWHGARRDASLWTKLSATLAPGATTLTLGSPVNWRVGDEIVIAPTGFDPDQTEKVKITAVGDSGQALTFTPPLKFQHWGTLQSYEGQAVDERAEVGLLTRDILIRSDPTSVDPASDQPARRFGGHVMVMNGVAHVEGVEFQQLGQETRIARYAFHWHHTGDGAGQWIKNSSVDGSFTRGIVVHGTSNALVEGNVVYDTHSHAYIFAEDGSEWNNVIRNNLALQMAAMPEARRITIPGAGKRGLQGDVQDEHRISGFWGANHNQTLVGNAAAGAEDGMGFLLTANEIFHVDEDQPAQCHAGVCEDRMVFEDNTGHSNFSQHCCGNDRYPPQATGYGLFAANIAGKLDFKRFTGYKNGFGGVWLESVANTLRGSVLADNPIGAVAFRSGVEDSLIVGQTANLNGRSTDKQVGPLNMAGGVHQVGYQGGDKVLRLNNVTIVNQRDAGVVALDYGMDATRSSVRGVRLVNTPRPVWFDYHGDNFRGGFQDLDGSLSGRGPGLVLGNYALQVTPDCTRRPEGQGWLCPPGQALVEVNVDTAGVDPQAVTASRDDGAVQTQTYLFPEGPLLAARDYAFDMGSGPTPKLTLGVRGAAGQWITGSVPYWAPTPPQVFAVNGGSRRALSAASLDAVRAGGGDSYAFDPLARRVYLKLVAGADPIQVCFAADCSGVVERDGPAPITNNLALGKLATQSSTDEGDAARAVDGNTDKLFEDGSVSLTQSEHQAWWQLDLGASSALRAVRLWAGNDCCTERPHDFYMLVSDQPFAPTLSAALAQPGVTAYAIPSIRLPEEIALKAGQRGRYLRLWQQGDGPIALAEVEVAPSN